MSLVGSLEDLGLGDIMQIITLSRKSGALVLRSEKGEGHVFFRDGLVCSASIKGQSPDLRGLVVSGGALSDADFESVRSEASEQGVNLSRAVAERIGAERFETLRRECVETAVLAMFGWVSGEFSFEVGQDPSDDEFCVVLETGINAQYLAMEGTRQTDEDQREPTVDPDDVASFADVAEEIDEESGVEVGVAEAVAETTAEGPADAFEAVALTTAERVDAAEPVAETVSEAPAAEARTEDAVEEAFAAALAAPEAPAPAAEPAAPSGECPPVIVLDEQLPLLEWVKGALDGVFPRVHIFQQAELAVARLRQYVARGEWPLLLVAPDLPIDGAHGWNDVDELVTRMKRQSPRSRVLWLGERGTTEPAHGEVVRPPDPSSTSLAGTDPLAAESLKTALLGAVGVAAPSEGPSLASVLARLSDPGTRGEVLNVVVEFAAGLFPRVALFAVRGGEAVGLAQAGLGRAGGPDDAALRGLELQVADSAWLSRLVEDRAPIRGPVEGDADTRLCAQLGDQLPAEAWLGGVISGGEVVAFLYGDGLPDGQPLPETGELEQALLEAGKALDAAVADRARAAAETA